MAGGARGGPSGGGGAPRGGFGGPSGGGFGGGGGGTGRYNLTFSVNFNNLLNHANFLLPVTNFNSVSFGQVQAAQAAREFQFGIKVHF